MQGPPVAAAWHYSGNYWWTTGAYFATLPPDIGPDYYDPERHLFLNRPRAALVWSTGLEGAGALRVQTQTRVWSTGLEGAGALRV